MPRIARESLLTLEAYAKERQAFRKRVLAHKKPRTVHLGEHLTLLFEDELTIRYQMQEMLRIEKTFEERPSRTSSTPTIRWCPTARTGRRRCRSSTRTPTSAGSRCPGCRASRTASGSQVEGQARVAAIADEDLERDNADKTSAVHFLRFELKAAMVAALKAGARLAIGVDHPHYRASLDPVPEATRQALLADLA